MLALDKTLKTIMQQLGGFTNTAKLLIGALMVILVMGLLLVANYAGRAELVPLGLSGAANAEAKAQAVSYLESRNIKWADRNGDVFVPAEQRIGVLADLTATDQITTDQIDFNKIIQNDSPFTGRDARNARYLIAKMNVVSRMIAQLNGVDGATVVIDEGRSGLGISNIEPTASVNVVPRGDQVSQTLADAVARMVAGAHAPLKVENVIVVDARTGRALKARTDDLIGAGNHLDLQRNHEKYFTDKIDNFLSYIPGVKVAVNAQVDASQEVQHRRTVEEPKLGVTGEKTEERSSTSAPPSGEPGVRPNTGSSLATASGGNSTSENRNETKMVPVFPTIDSNIIKDRGYAVKINATVLVPRSYFLSVYRLSQGDEAADPEPAALDALVLEETQKIQAQVEPLIDTEAKEGAIAGAVMVSMIPDFNADSGGFPGPDGGVAGSGGSSGVGSLLSSSLARTVGLAALALVSLAIMFMMVRKASRHEEMPTAEELVGIPPALAQHGSDLVGEAEETIAAMEGLEVDEGDIRRQQMLEQINDLAAQEPSEAATLLRKWVRDSD